MKGIYYIKNKVNNKIYIGKSTNIKQRLIQHKYYLCKDTISKKACNRHLYSAVQKYGWDNFETGILELCENLEEAELKWMDSFKSCDRNCGYNLRRDTSTKCIVHDETRLLQSMMTRGANNPNYNNKWSDAQKEHMSKITKDRHASGQFYGEDWKLKQSINAKITWSDLEKRKEMGAKVSIAKQKYVFNQYTRDYIFIKQWQSVNEIIEANPNWKWQNIYSVCNGYKPTYMNYIWRKELKI